MRQNTQVDLRPDKHDAKMRHFAYQPRWTHTDLAPPQDAASWPLGSRLGLLGLAQNAPLF